MQRLILITIIGAFVSLSAFAQVQQRQDTTKGQTEYKKDAQHTEERDDELGNESDQAVQEDTLRSDEAAQDTVQNDDDGLREESSQSEDPKAESGVADQPTEAAEGAEVERTGAGLDVEILESKEGPNGEIVYKHNNELFYVDRNEQKIVKVKEADLRDSNATLKIKRGNEKQAVKKATRTDDKAKKTEMKSDQKTDDKNKYKKDDN